MSNAKKAAWTVVGLFLAIPMLARADVVGSWAAKGTLYTTHSKPAHSPVISAGDVNETLVFNADHGFSRGTLTGVWKQRRNNPSLYDVVYDRNSYIDQLNSYWANLGVTASNIRILENKLVVREISNGLLGDESLKYKFTAVEGSRTRPVTVSVKAAFFAPNAASENSALMEFFPAMSPEASFGAYGFVITLAPNFPTMSVIVDGGTTPNLETVPATNP